MSLAQQILQVELVRDQGASESPAVVRTTAEQAVQWPVMDEICSKKEEKNISSFRWHRAAPVPDLYFSAPGQDALWVGPRH